MKPTWKQRDDLAILERVLRSLVLETKLSGGQVQQVVDQVRKAQTVPVTPRTITATTKQAFKQQIAVLIKDLIHARRWTHPEAAQVLKTTRIRISKICTGKLGAISLDALMDYLAQFGETVTITVTPQPSSLSGQNGRTANKK